MIYSDVLKQGLILPYKKKYTMKDVNKLIVDSLFQSKHGTLTMQTAVFICKCSAVYHGTTWSKSLI